MDEKKKKTTLTKRQQDLIAAMLVAPTTQEAAERAGVCEYIVYRWMKDPTFSKALSAARNAALERAINRLALMTGKACDALERALDCGQPSVEYKAALGIFDRVFRGLEDLEMRERIEALEAKLNEKP